MALNAKLILCRLAIDAGLVAMVVLHHLQVDVSWCYE